MVKGVGRKTGAWVVLPALALVGTIGCSSHDLPGPTTAPAADAGLLPRDGALSPTDGALDDGLPADAGPVQTAALDAGAASITSVKIEGAGSSQQAPQGAALMLDVAGTQLGSFTQATLGSLTGTVTVLSASALKVAVTLPHGQPLGGLALTLSRAGGATLSQSGAVTVTHLTCGPSGSDSAMGTPDAPFRTVSHALSVSGAGDTIDLRDGTYNETSGESWPSDSALMDNVPDHVTLVGQSQAGTILESTLAASSQSVGLAFAANAAVQTLTLRGFGRALEAAHAGSVDLNSVDASGIDNALFTWGSGTVGASSSSFHDSTTGIASFGTSTVQLLYCTVSNNSKDGFWAGGQSSISVSGSSVSGNGMAGTTIWNSGVYLTDSATATLEASVTNNHVAGVSSTSSGALTFINGNYDDNSSGSCAGGDYKLCGNLVLEGSGPVSITGGTFDGSYHGIIWISGTPSLTVSSAKLENNAYSGLTTLTSGGSVKVRGTTIDGNGVHAIATAGTPFDLGGCADPGNNALSQAAGFAHYAVRVDAGFASFSHTTINGVNPSPKIVSGPADSSPSWFVANGNQIVFQDSCGP